MNIVILGAGQVGGSLARNLANEDNDITIIDTDELLYANYAKNWILPPDLVKHHILMF